MDDDLPFEKIAISGATLASVIQRSISSPCDIDGLLFGHVTRLAPTSLSDDSPSPSSSSSLLLIPTITSIISFSHPLSFYDPLGRVHLPTVRCILPPSPANPPTLLGFFVARRSTPLRPSMREFSVSSSLHSQTLTLNQDPNDPLSAFLSPLSPPSIFLLLASSSLSVHTHEYRAFQLRRRSSGPTLEPQSLDVVNIGPAFRPHYGAFCPSSPFPWLPVRAGAEASVVVVGGEDDNGGRGSLGWMKRVSKEQRGLDACAEGFEVERLSRLMGSEAANYTSELEDLYGKMLAKLEGLARAVEKSSARVLEQEHRNIKLRCKVAGSE